MAESAGRQQQEKSRSLIKPTGDRAARRQPVSTRHGAADSELSEEGSSPLQHRAAVRPVPDSAAAEAPASAESQFAYDLSRVPTHTETPGTGPGVQAKLTVSTPGDRFEQEADRVADQVMTMPTATDLAGVEDQDEGSVAGKPLVQRQSDSVPQVSDKLEGWLAARQGSGRPLEDQDRSFMESRFGVDLSAVRVHTDSASVQASRELDAQAFTYGRDIHFGVGRYAPGTAAGRRLLAHELTHVVQQTGGLGPKQAVSPAAGASAGRDLDADDSQVRPLVGHDTAPVVGALARLNVDQVVGRGHVAQFKKTKKRKTLRERVTDLEQKAEWNKRRADAHLTISVFEGKMGESKTDWGIAMSELGDAYFLGYKDHKDALAKQQKWEELQVAILCGVLTAVAGGALGGLGEFLQKAEDVPKFLQRFTTESAAGRLEDIIQAGMGETIDVVQSTYIPATGSPVSKEPELFRSGLARSLDGQWLKAQEFFTRAKQALLAANEADFEDVSVEKLKKKIESFKKTSKFYKRPTHHPVEKMRKEQERWIWSEWLPRNLTKWEWGYYKYGGKYKTQAYYEPGKYVMIAMDRLGISKKAGISESGWARFFLSERIPLLNWAKSPQPPIQKFEF